MRPAIKGDTRVYEKQNPALGIVVTETNIDEVIRATLRAQSKGYEVFLVEQQNVEFYDVSTLPNVNVVETLGADESHENEMESMLQELRQTARAHGHSGLIYYQSPGLIDYEASEVALRESEAYAVWAEIQVEKVRTLIAIPAYNESSEIGSVVTNAAACADTVLVVDDGSDDDTIDVAEAAGATVVQHERNRGYGGALKTIFAEAKRRSVDYLIVIDGDGQHDPSEVRKLLSQLKEGPEDIVIGSRFTGETNSSIPKYRLLGLSVINLMTNLSMGRGPRRWLSDTQSGFRGYSKEAIASFDGDSQIGNGMAASTDILYRADNRGFEIGEVGVTINYDVEETSTHHPLKHGLSLLRNILQTIQHTYPLTILGVPGVISSVVGVGLAYWVLHAFLVFNTFAVEPAVASILFGVVGMLMSVTAIVLYALKVFHAGKTG